VCAWRERENGGIGLTNDEDGSIPTTLWVCGVVDEGIALAAAADSSISHG